MVVYEAGDPFQFLVLAKALFLYWQGIKNLDFLKYKDVATSAWSAPTFSIQESIACLAFLVLSTHAHISS